MTSVTITVKAIDQASSVLKNIVGGASGLTSALSMGITAAAAAATSAMQFFADSVAEADKTQLSMISTTGNMMAAMGTTYQESEEFVKRLQTSAVNMGAALPGVAESYALMMRNISNDIAGALRLEDADVGFDEIQGWVERAGKRFQLMAEATGTSAAKASTLFMRLIAGDKNPLLRNVMFAQLPGFKDALNQIMEAEGATLDRWKEYSRMQRVEWLTVAAEMALPEDAVSKMTETVSATLNRWRTAIFDQTSGMLGFLRDLTSRGGTNIMGVLRELLVSAENAFMELVRIFPFQGDPMVVLHDALYGLKSMLDTTTGFLQGVQNLSSTVSEGLRNFIAAIAPGINQTFLDLIAFIGSSLPDIVNTIGSGWSFAMTAIDWGSLGAGVGSGFMILLSNIVAAIGVTLANLDYGQIIAALYQTTFAIFSFFNGFWAGVRDQTLAYLSETLSILPGIIRSALFGTVQVVQTAIGSLPGRMTEAAHSMVENLAAIIRNTLSNIFNSVTGAVSGLKAPSPVAMAGGTIPNAATGLDTIGLLDAVKREKSRAPGAGMVLANSTETILTNSQARSVADSMSRRQIAPVFNISIHGVSTDPQILADTLMRTIGRELASHALTY